MVDPSCGIQPPGGDCTHNSTPDHSSIDLAAILTAEDLPVWLQEIARRSTVDQDGLDATTATPVSVTGSVSPETPADPLDVSDVVPQPWWASDRIMAGLLIAVALTILFVLITTISVT
jgi:hypothetical protein